MEDLTALSDLDLSFLHVEVALAIRSLGTSLLDTMKADQEELWSALTDRRLINRNESSDKLVDEIITLTETLESIKAEEFRRGFP